MALPHHTSTRKAESTRGSILVRTAPEAPGLHRGRPAWLPPATADEGITTRKVKSCHKALPWTVRPPSGDPRSCICCATRSCGSACWSCWLRPPSSWEFPACSSTPRLLPLICSCNRWSSAMAAWAGTDPPVRGHGTSAHWLDRAAHVRRVYAGQRLCPGRQGFLASVIRSIFTRCRETRAPSKLARAEQALLSEVEYASLRLVVARLGEGIADDTSGGKEFNVA